MSASSKEFPGTPPLGKSMPLARLRLLIAFALFAAWMGWLIFAAVNKSHAPIVSKAQVATWKAEAGIAVVAKVTAGPDGKPLEKVSVVETIAEGPAPGAEVEIVNLSEVNGFVGSGDYLLLLIPIGSKDQFKVIGPQPSPGYDLVSNGKAAIYSWSSDVQAQLAHLRK